jgi:membrane-associated phospholipid phosphatase
VIPAVLIGVLGVVALLGIGGVVLARPDAFTAPAARPWPWLARLRTARAELTGTLGPVGAFVLLLGGGVLVVTAIAALFGLGVALLEHPVDWWAFHLADRLRSRGWASLMNVVTQTGNIPETRTAGVVFAVLLAFVTPRRWWAPPVLIFSVIVVEKYQQSLLGAIVDRGHPPTTLGTYPSGGCARLISIYGVILFLLLEAFHASRRTRIAAWTVLSVAAFAEGYSRWYLNKHWLTDVVGGWVYGGLLLAVALFAGRALTGNGHEADTTTSDRTDPVSAVSGNS